MTRTRWMGLASATAVVLASALALSLAGCAAHPSEYGTPPPIPKPTTAIDSPEEMCGDGYLTPPIAPSSTLWLPTDGGWFHTGLVGDPSDTSVAVFVHQADLGFCGWWTYAQYLAKHGVRSMMLNLCGFGLTLCPADAFVMASGADAVRAAAAWARDHGATRVVAVGASMGGTTAVLAASQDKDHELDAFADLSGPIAYLDANTNGAGSDITIPSFFAVDPSDTVVSVFQMQNLAKGIQSPQPILHLDGVGHGWSMLHDTTSGAFEFDVLAVQLASFIEGTPASG